MKPKLISVGQEKCRLLSHCFKNTIFCEKNHKRERRRRGGTAGFHTKLLWTVFCWQALMICASAGTNNLGTNKVKSIKSYPTRTSVSKITSYMLTCCRKNQNIYALLSPKNDVINLSRGVTILWFSSSKQVHFYPRDIFWLWLKMHSGNFNVLEVSYWNSPAGNYKL